MLRTKQMRISSIEVQRMYYISSDLSIKGSPDSFRYLSHHGIKGQKWGVRRFQNEDGTLTNAGKKRRSDNGQHYTWLQDKLGYDERDRLLKGEADKAVADTKARVSGNAVKSKSGLAAYARMHANIAKQNHEYAMQNYGSNSQYDAYVRAESEASELEAELDALKKEHEADVEEYKKQEELVQALIVQYNRTPLGLLDSSKIKINNGKKKINHFLSSIKARLKK